MFTTDYSYKVVCDMFSAQLSKQCGIIYSSVANWKLAFVCLLKHSMICLVVRVYDIL